VLIAAATGYGADSVLTLRQAIAIGLENNYDIRIARGEARIADNNSGYGTAQFLPTVDVTGGYNYNDQQTSTTSPFSFGDSRTETKTAQVQLNWTLFDGFRMFTERARFAELAKLGREQARLTIENRVVAIAQAYFNLVQQEQRLGVNREALEVSRTRLEKDRVRRDLGGVSSTDYLNAEVFYNNDRAAVINQELAVTTARQSLNLALGRDPETPVAVSSEIEIPDPAYTVDDLMQRATERNAGLAVARHSLNAAGHRVGSVRSRFIPRVWLNAGVGYTNRVQDAAIRDEDITTETTDKFVGLQASWNIFNGRRDWVEWQNARVEENIARLSLNSRQHQLKGEVVQRLETFRKRMELVALEVSNRDAARRNLELQRDLYATGAVTSLEYRDAQINYTRAQLDLITARYQARIALLQIEQLIADLPLQ
jgi:outer membrane protein TolC